MPTPASTNDKNVDCRHWSACSVSGGGCCAIGRYGGRPSRGICTTACRSRETLVRSADLPPVRQQAANLAQAVKRVVRSAVKRERVATTEQERDRRLAICGACDNYIANRTRCKLCGCFLRTKIKFATEHCPVEKW